MSTLVVNTLKAQSGSLPPVVQNSSGTEIGYFAKAWIVFDGTGTVSVRDSFNHASLTDRGTGDYTLGFTNNFASNDYCPQFAGLRGATDENYDAHPSFISGSEDTALTTSTLLTSTCYNNSTQADMLQNYVTIDGDLA